MQSFIILTFEVVAFFVTILNWKRIRKPDILIPSVIIALAGGITNTISSYYVYGAAPTPWAYVQGTLLVFLVIAAGLHLSEKAGLPGLWPRAGNAELPGRRAEAEMAESPATQQQRFGGRGRVRSRSRSEAEMAESPSPRRRGIGERVKPRSRADVAESPAMQQRVTLVASGALAGALVGFAMAAVGPGNATSNPAFTQILNALSGENARRYLALLIVQSGLVEEPIYRLFAISAITEGLTSAGIDRRLRIAAAVLASSLLFGLIPAHNIIVGILMGLVLGAAYLRVGIIPLMVAHCVGNAVQLPLLLGLWK